MSILRGLHIVLWIIVASLAFVSYDMHLRQVSALEKHATVEASKLKADADSAWAAYYASADEAAEWQGKAQSLNIKAKFLEAAVDGLTPEPITNPDPMSATVKLSIAGGGHGSATHIGGGYLITAGHVAEKEGDRLTARFQNGDEYEAVTLWSNRRYDIALVKIDGSGLPSSNLECRAPDRQESIWLYGNPQSSEFIVTQGTVAGKPREMAPNWAEVVPVDASMGPGMSGGGAFDADGDLIGINVGTQFSARAGAMGPDVYTIGINMIVPASTICSLGVGLLRG